MKNLVAAVDLSPFTENVVRVAADLARVTGANLHLLHVAADEPTFIGFDIGPQYIRDSEARRLSEEHRGLHAIDRRLEDEGLRVTSLMWRGDPAEKILDLCDRVAADLVIIGSHGRSALAEALVGGTTHTILKRSRCPVVVAPAVGSRP